MTAQGHLEGGREGVGRKGGGREESEGGRVRGREGQNGRGREDRCPHFRES